MPTSEVPIACTLDRASYDDRMAAVRALFARALKHSRRDGQRLHLTFDAAARDDVEDLIRKEKSCCAFLEFDVREADGAILLTITAPAGAAADEIFAPFAARTSCGCAPAPKAAPRSGKVLSILGFGGLGAAFLCGAACIAAGVLVAAGVGGTWIAALEGADAWAGPALALAAAALAAAWLLRRRALRRGGSRPRESELAADDTRAPAAARAART